MTQDVTWLVELQEMSFAGANAATAGSFPPQRRMTGEQLLKVLTTRRNAVVATTRKDGRPHNAPGAFVFFDQGIWLPVVAGAARVRNVSRQPWVSMVITSGDGDRHAVIIIEGSAVVTSSPPDGFVEAAKRKLDSLSWVDRWIHLTPAKLLSYAAEKWEHGQYGEDSGRDGVLD